jgi:predicted lipoprotein with Yx(FWY)xxD motif
LAIKTWSVVDCSVRAAVTILAGLVLFAGLAFPAAANGYGPLMVQKAAGGEVLPDPNGMTVYTFDHDTQGKSNYKGECAEFWPPVKDAAGAMPTGDLSVITRDDGSKHRHCVRKPQSPGPLSEASRASA